MAAVVAVYSVSGRRRSMAVCRAMARGIDAVGDRARIVDQAQYAGPDADVAVFYGLEGRIPGIFRDYPKASRVAVYVDLGYWGRRDGGRFRGFHKVAVNSRHPTAYFRRLPHDPGRFKATGLKIGRWNRGGSIIVAGMSAKAAHAEGFAPEEWERGAIATLRKHTDRPIIYRPKPSWPGATNIPGATLQYGPETIDSLLADCHAVVTHHSNAAVDALVGGVPVFCEQGVASVLGESDLSLIEKPVYPVDREGWAADVAWCQFSVDEMAAGLAWRHLKDEGLVPC